MSPPITERAVLAELAGLLGSLAQRDAPLGARTTYRVGGPAALLVEANGLDDLAHVHRALAAVAQPVPFLTVGQGSNLLVADEGFPGLVVVLGPSFATVVADPPKPGRSNADADPDTAAGQVVAGGAAPLPVVARRSVAGGWRGLEWAVGVPGSVGGAVRMNAGGHGADIAGCLVDCTIYDLERGRTDQVGVAELDLRYRRSRLGAAQIVVEARLRVRPGDRSEGEALVAEIVRWRRQHQPGGANCGSVFTNPEGDAAGRLVEAAGVKGLRLGTAQVSTKHANFIQADPGGRAHDVRRLIEHVADQVLRRTGVVLVPEVRMVGFPDQPQPTVEVRR